MNEPENETKPTEETKPKGPAISTLDTEKDQLKVMLAFREWIAALEWPEYVGSIHMGLWSTITVGPADPENGFPEHFAVDMMKLLPFGDNGLRKRFNEGSGTITWIGQLDNDKLPEEVGKTFKKMWWQIDMVFPCGQNTDCKLTFEEVTKEVTEKVWSMDCSGKSEALAEII